MRSGSGVADMALGWKGSCWEHIAIPFSDVLARGALTCLVKVTPEQIIRTSNLNILKSRNNIESCWLYCKVLRHFLNRVKNKLGIMWIISLHMSSPGIWHMDQHDGMEQGSHGNISLEKNLPGCGNAWHFIRRFPHFLNHIPGMVSELWKTGAINALHPVLKIKTHLKQNNPHGKKYWQLLTSICVFSVCVVQAPISVSLWSQGS